MSIPNPDALTTTSQARRTSTQDMHESVVDASMQEGGCSTAASQRGRQAVQNDDDDHDYDHTAGDMGSVDEEDSDDHPGNVPGSLHGSHPASMLVDALNPGQDLESLTTSHPAAADSPMQAIDDVNLYESCSSVSEAEDSLSDSNGSSIETEESLQSAAQAVHAAENLLTSMRATNRALQRYAEALKQRTRSRKRGHR